MFFSKKNSEKIQEPKLDIQKVIERVCDAKRITLAISFSESFIGFGKSHLGTLSSRLPDLTLKGVLHEQWKTEIFIPCSINITASMSNIDDEIGWCSLTNISDVPNKNLAKLSFDVTIFDPTGEINRAAKETLRDHALSEYNFCHFAIEKEVLNTDNAKKVFEKDGHGPTAKVIGIKMWPQITLPKAPSWAPRE